MNLENIRNFCIIAHIDHGKSTLADRLIEITHTVEDRKMKAQLLDQMDLERERGITIKLQPVKMEYKDKGKKYILNLIDTPGHVDFTYEVSRSLAAVEGAILLVDATQGIQAQTIANLYLAMEQDLIIIPTINKIDMPSAMVPEVEQEIMDLIGCEREDILKISAKTGENVEKILARVISEVPCPTGDINAPARALIFDSYFDSYKGVVAQVRIVDGEIKVGEEIAFLGSKAASEILELGIITPELKKRDSLQTGEIGYIATGLKEVGKCRVGDTITNLHEAFAEENAGKVSQLPGYKEVRPVVFASVYPIDGADYPALRDALDKLKLSDASLSFEPESSTALGRGFRCGFLGMLHLEIVSERLTREYDMNLVVTTPSVSYQVVKKTGEEEMIFSPAGMPDPNHLAEIREPWAKLEIVLPEDKIGRVMALAENSRATYKSTSYLSKDRVILTYEAPLLNIIVDFYDNLKSISSGYASMSYEPIGFRLGNLIKLDILIADEKVEAFSRIVPREEAHTEGKKIVEKLKEAIPRQNFAIALQAAISGKIVARETIKPFRKDVTAKLYGGDVSRKNKLLDKQKKGKKKMKSIGKVDIPQEAFLSVLKKN
ncbi:MAG: translation elongation factor 4 [Candidatus Pacebacteria bacterium]|nr:translation elongation factor 4 [Candidatus Paceibacterota bacterium]